MIAPPTIAVQSRPEAFSVPRFIPWILREKIVGNMMELKRPTPRMAYIDGDPPKVMDAIVSTIAPDTKY